MNEKTIWHGCIKFARFDQNKMRYTIAQTISFESLVSPISQHHIHEACPSKLAKLKKENPRARFRLESRGLTKEKITTSSVRESGLEQPEEYFVELQVYEDAYGAPNPNDIVDEEAQCGSGVLKPGVTHLHFCCFNVTYTVMLPYVLCIINW